MTKALVFIGSPHTDYIRSIADNYEKVIIADTNIENVKELVRANLQANVDIRMVAIRDYSGMTEEGLPCATMEFFLAVVGVKKEEATIVNNTRKKMLLTFKGVKS